MSTSMCEAGSKNVTPAWTIDDDGVEQFNTNIDTVQHGAPWAFVAVMGVTGAGKSTFIKTVSRDETVIIGEGLESCTSELKGYSFHFQGHNINLIDSPGFNDTFRSETDVLQDISTWLKQCYEKKTHLTGIIYLHGINHSRLEGSALRNLRMFQELCGEDPMKNIVLATTFWDEVKLEAGQRREKQLTHTNAFWGGMIEHGSRTARFTDRDSGLRILASLLGHKAEPLKIQRELVDDSKSLVETAAGQVVNAELSRLEAEHRQKEAKMKEDLEDAIRLNNFKLQEILKQERRRLEGEVDRVHRQQEQLREDRRTENRVMQNRLEDFRMETEELQEMIEQLSASDRKRQKERNESERARKAYQALNETLINEIHAQRERHAHERSIQNARLRQLEQYNELARQRWQNLDLDAVIAKIRAEEGKLRVEDREKLEGEINRLQKKPKMSKARKKSILTKIFFGALQVAIPVASFFTLGMPIPIPGLSSFFDEDGDEEDGGGGSA